MKHVTFRAALLLTVTAVLVATALSPQAAAAKYPYCNSSSWCSGSTTNCPCSCPGMAASSTCEEYAQGVGNCFPIQTLIQQGVSVELPEWLQGSDLSLDETSQPQLLPSSKEEPKRAQDPPTGSS